MREEKEKAVMWEQEQCLRKPPLTPLAMHEVVKRDTIVTDISHIWKRMEVRNTECLVTQLVTDGGFIKPGWW